MSTDPEIDDLTYLITHVFYPLRLPIEDDHSVSNDLGLSQGILSSARAYEGYICDEHSPEWTRILAMLCNLSATMQAHALRGEEVESQLKSMDIGGTFVGGPNRKSRC
jgi:hypothetical protein